MNRLWVRISLVIALVAVFIALFPLVTRHLTAPGEVSGELRRPYLADALVDCGFWRDYRPGGGRLTEPKYGQAPDRTGKGSQGDCRT